MFMQIKRLGLAYRAWYYLERRLKETCFDCSMCGQCVLRTTAFICPNQCPKQMRNGPCGGSMEGRCEVYPDRRCIWTRIYRRAAHRAGGRRKLAAILPAMDWSLYGTSAWLNLWPGHKIDRAGLARSPRALPGGNRWTPPGGGAEKK
jgi:methylenetetrahydrofolate reductase (NADPH)